jgi:hypothetical protein
MSHFVKAELKMNTFIHFKISSVKGSIVEFFMRILLLAIEEHSLDRMLILSRIIDFLTILTRNICKQTTEEQKCKRISCK